MSAEIIIQYCTIWNYEPKAVSLAATLLALKEDLKSLSLVPSGRGAFEVIVNGKLLYSKLRTGDFPDFNAIFAAVKSMCWDLPVWDSAFADLPFLSDIVPESDACLVAAAVFKIVAPALRAGG